MRLPMLRSDGRPKTNLTYSKVRIMKNLVTALIFTFATTVWAGDFEDGFAASEAGDYKTAFSFYKKAAEQGELAAQFNVGLYYDVGKGVLQDYVEAVRWYKLAAAQGYSIAQLNLGARYANGKGVLQDYAEAVRWYKLAAVRGNADAQFNLSQNYATGKGVLQDDLQAHMWMNLAAVSGDKGAQKARDVIAEQMTIQQIAKAQAMAKKCLVSKYKDCD